MEVYQIENPQEIKDSNFYLGLGTFDGVHKGHRLVIETARKKAEKLGVRTGVFTFWPHPLAVLAPGYAPPLLTSLEDKLNELSRAGAQVCFVQKFNRDFAAYDYSEFIEEYLVKRLSVLGTVVGKKFRFGDKGEGDGRRLKEAGEKFGFETVVLDPLKIQGNGVSSTFIRGLIKEGRMEEIPLYLGRNYSLQVKTGQAREREQYFSLEIELPKFLARPPAGYYGVCFVYNGERHPGILAQKSNSNGRSSTLYLQNTAFHLMGKQLRLIFVRRLRDAFCRDFKMEETLQKICRELTV